MFEVSCRRGAAHHRPAASMLVILCLVSAACARSLPDTEPADAATAGRSSTRITADQIKNYPSSTIEEIMVLHFPGLQVRGRSEAGGPGLQILGMGRPLFVIDGVPLEHSGGSLPLNPRDVEFIELIKYGAATSLYGIRGANGVIVIKTKR